MAYKRLPGKPTDEERFWLHVEKTESCWLWTGTRTPHGYGQIRINGKLRPAHRWAYEHWIGPVPKELHLDHLCRVTYCVRPSHVEPVTPRENFLRGVGPSAQHARKTHCVHGHEFTPENTRINKRGGRVCRTCHREKERVYAQDIAKDPARLNRQRMLGRERMRRRRERLRGERKLESSR